LSGATDQEGARIGRYEIVRSLGRGGSGDVYLANQTENIRVQVALKVLRAAALDERAIARFEAECDALMRMDHVGIARVLDAGFSDEGRPFVAIEYVDGHALGDFLAAGTMPVEERLKLFVRICAAVQHAHIKGVVHRDLKPSNVLIAESDVRPMLIDFGISRATDRSPDLDPLFTQHAEVLGTPSYMSPEQTLGGSADVDVRSDVYALGALLYEMLTGAPPLAPETLADLSIEQTLCNIREKDATRPSRVDPAIASDLDAITLKALAKEPERRYQSVADLAEDIERFLANKPVDATPPTASYRLGKFVRRNRAMVAGTAIAIVSLLAGTAISIGQAARAKEAEREVTQKAEEVVAEKQVSEEERQLSEAINQFLVEDLLGQDLRRNKSPNVTLRELVDGAADKTEERFVGQPLVARDVEEAIGDVYRALTEYEKAHERYARSRELNDQLRERSDYFASAEQIIRKLALVRSKQGRMEDARAYWREWDALIEGEDIGTTVKLEARNLQLQLLDEDKRLEPAKKLLADFVSHLGENHSQTAIVRYNYAENLLTSGNAEAAIPLLERHVELLRESRSVALVDVMAKLGRAYAETGKLEPSDAIFDEMQSLMDEVLTPEHENWTGAQVMRADAYSDTGRHHLAGPIFKELFETGLSMDGPMPLNRIVAGFEYGMFLSPKPEEAIKVMRQVVACYEDLGEGHGLPAVEALFAIAVLETRLGHIEEALVLFKDVLSRRIELQGESHPRVMSLRSNIAIAEQKLERYDAMLLQIKAIVEAPAPENPRFRKDAKMAVRTAMQLVVNFLPGKFDASIDVYLKAINQGLMEEEAWQGLGLVLFKRYIAKREIDDLRYAVVSNLMGRTKLNADGIAMITHWVGEDPLAKGLEVPRILAGQESEWRYQAATPVTSEWRMPSFDASSWPIGRGKMGFGESDLDTTFEPGPVASACFRLELQLDKQYDQPLHATIAHDDGGIVFVDGVEVYRGNIGPGAPDRDRPSQAIESIEGTPHGFLIDPSHFGEGGGVITIQVHQTRQVVHGNEDDLWLRFALNEPAPTLDEVLKRLPQDRLKAFFGDLLPIGDE